MSAGAASSGSAAGTSRALRVEAVFHDVDQQQAEEIAAEIIARAQELANSPDCACDLDLTVESLPPDDRRGTAAAGAADRSGSPGITHPSGSSSAADAAASATR